MQQRVAFIFQFNRVLSPAARRDLEAVWSVSGGAQCFSEVLFVSVNQTDAQEANVIEATCHQHYRTYAQVLAQGYSHWFQYETDVLPVRTGWLDRVVEEAVRNGDCERWWVQGASWGYNPAPVTRHQRVDGIMLNGNALYCINQEVLGYLEDVVEQFSPIGCHDDPTRTTSNWFASLRARALPGFDTVQYWYRTSVKNRDKLQARAHLFVAVDWIADLNRMDPAVIRQLVDSRPSLVLVHTKSFFNDTRSSWEKGTQKTQGQHLSGSYFATLACWVLACVCVVKAFRSRLEMNSPFGRSHPRAGQEAPSKQRVTFL